MRLSEVLVMTYEKLEVIMKNLGITKKPAEEKKDDK